MSPKSIDSLVIFDFSTPGSTSPESLHAESYEILRVKKPRGGSVKGIIISFYVWLNSFLTRIIAETGVLSEMNK